MSIPIEHLNSDPLTWLLERDAENPGIRYFVLRDLMDRSESDPDVHKARADLKKSGPVPAILDTQHPDGYWAKPGGGYSQSYRATAWQIIFLAELGADPRDVRVQRGCEYLFSHTIASNGAFSMGVRPVPSQAIHCLNGDLVYALICLGYSDDPRLRAAAEWQAQAIIGAEGIRYYKSGTTGPDFACVANDGKPCAWGTVKALKGLAAIPPSKRTAPVQGAIEFGGEFLLSRDLAMADYPNTGRVNSNWFKFGFPLSYQSDVLETMVVLTKTGCGDDSRLENALQFILNKQDDQGRWNMEKSLNGKMWIDIEEKGKPSKWITLQVLRVLNGIEPTNYQ